jgi:tRNA(adenine34) deaminase
MMLDRQASSAQDEQFMALAMAEADDAARHGDIPVGCVLVHEGVVLAKGRNLRQVTQDPTAHAEVVAIRAASVRLGTWRLLDVTCYVTLEPCAMCAGALVHARIGRLVYGCDDPKAGAVRSLYEIGSDARLNHRFALSTGVLGDACSKQLSGFFAEVRARKRGV